MLLKLWHCSTVHSGSRMMSCWTEKLDNLSRELFSFDFYAFFKFEKKNFKIKVLFLIKNYLN